ncbi:MAG: TonB-dependent receptor [Acidobacteria bacterium]|nr:TonB-dependent receptor [Acidobacteriota bacterium]
MSSVNKVMRILAFSAGLLMILALAQIVSAQETRGTIRGTVVDPNKASVPGAVVKIVDTARGTTTTLTTNDEGIYQANYMIPSTYQITVEASGFKRTLRENVQLQINQTLSIDFALEIGGNQETVTVTTESPALESSNASLGQTIDQRRISELPLVHGDPYTLIGLSSGVTYTGSTRLDRPFEPTHIVGFAVDGTRGNRSDLTIDGAPSTATANANEVIATYVPPTDIVQEFKVQTATFDAQFGNTEGGVTSISIKSGTNTLHGAAYYFAEPWKWAANDFFGNSRGQARPVTKSDRFGFSVNGPVYLPWLYNGKDKTFFLFGYEGIRDSRPRFDASSGSWVPTQAIANGDFSGLGVTIWDPLTRIAGTGTGTGGNGCATGAFCAQTSFTNAIIPTNRINPVARAVMTYFAKPKQSGLVGNIFDSTLSETTKPYDNWTFKIDQNITEKNHLFFRGSWYDRNSLYNRYTDSAYTGVNFIFASRQAVIDDVHTFNSTTFLNLRAGYNRFIREQDQQSDAHGIDLTTLGWTSNYNSLVPELIRRFPRFDFSGGPLGNGMSNEFRPVDTQSFAAILNKVWGNHSFKFGAELRTYIENDNFESNDQTGQFSFDNTYTRQASNSTAGEVSGLQGMAAFLLGLPTTQQIVRRADYSEYSKSYGIFVQDDWKVNTRLTLNLGLRYDVETPLQERQNKSVSGFDTAYVQPIQAAVRTRLTTNPVTGYDGTTIDPNSFNVTGGLLFAGKDGGSGLYKTPKNTWLPRFGAAYQLNEKTVIRGGFGLFAGFLGERRGDVIQPGYTQTTTLALTTLASGAPIPQSISNFPTAISVIEPVGNAKGKQTGIGTGISFFNQTPKVSKQFRYQIGVQRQLPWGFVAEAIYVGNYGYDIEISRNLNALPNRYLNADNARTTAMTSNNTVLTTGVANPFLGLPEVAGTSFANSTIARSQLLLPFPEFGAITGSNNDGKSWYHSGQFSLQKRFSQGYTFQASYTWSKWLQATEYLNAGDAQPTKMVSDQDSPHRFSASAMVELPFGKGKWLLSNANPVVDRIVNGWQFGGVYTFQVGFPVSFTTDLFYRGGQIKINSKDRTTGAWFNTSAFASAFDFASFLPTGVTPGTATAAQWNAAVTSATTAATPQNHLRTLPLRFTDVRRDNINNVDLSLIKDTRINERMKIQIRFEMINAFNEPYFPAPLVTPGSTTSVNGFNIPTFGTISASNQDNYARRAQFGIKFLF